MGTNTQKDEETSDHAQKHVLRHLEHEVMRLDHKARALNAKI